MRISDWSSDVCSSDLRSHPALAQDRGVLMAMADIDQQQPSTRLEYAHDFDQRTLPLVASCDVMQCPAGDHDIEAAGIERQVARIGCTEIGRASGRESVWSIV